jgi:spore coat polysaccharide biosynthesis protein SpsF
MLRVFIQARMSSRRFPGKVLAPFRGKPVVDHVLARISSAVPRDRIVLATSTEPSDDPLALHVERRGVAVFRGPLDDVVSRFQLCLEAFPCAWFARISADSPLMDGSLVTTLAAHTESAEHDLVTNVFPRSFPKGQSVEILRADTFRSLAPETLTPEEREHVTKVYYDHPERFRIVNVPAEGPSRAALNLCIDTLEDLARLEGAP